MTIGQEQREFTIEPGASCHIGRGHHNTIELPNESVSRAHAMVQFAGSGSCFLYDLESRNGTQLNGRRISTPTPLRHGDRIIIGPYTLAFIYAEAAHSVLSPLSPATEAAIIGRQQQVTTTVVNLRDYTGLERRLGVTRLAEIVAALHQEARTILEDMGASTQKYIGPTIVAVWVHRAAKPPLNVVLSAFESISRIARIALGLQGRFALEIPIQVTAGLETGPASLDRLESATSDLAALDDAVNRAFRIDSSTKDPDGEIAFGAVTGEILLQSVPLDEIAHQRSMTLDGAAEPAPVWTMSLDALSRLLISLPQATVSIQLPQSSD